MMSEVIETRGKYRTRIEREPDGQAPYDARQAPVLQTGGHRYGETIPAPFTDAAVGFERVLMRYMLTYDDRRTARKTFERYLRAYHGTRSFRHWNTDTRNGHGYIAFDTAAWREAMGITEEHMNAPGGPDPEHLADATLAEIRAWVEGSLWTVIVERRHDYVKTYLGEDGAASVHGHDWIEVEHDDGRAWVHYGMDRAARAAAAALDRATEPS